MREGLVNKRPMGQSNALPAHRHVEVTQCESMGLMGRGEVYQYLTDLARRFSCHLTHMIYVTIWIDSIQQAHISSHSDHSVNLA
jgi:hypothetical protein